MSTFHEMRMSRLRYKTVWGMKFWGKDGLWHVEIPLGNLFIGLRLPLPLPKDELFPLYFYISRDSSPTNALLILGKAYSHALKAKATLRRKLFGWYKRDSMYTMTKMECRELAEDFLRKCVKDHNKPPNLDFLIHVQTEFRISADNDYTYFLFLQDSEIVGNVQIDQTGKDIKYNLNRTSWS